MSGRARYTLLRKIADGGMAEIFLATQRGAEGFEKPVVLKRILPALCADPQFRNMLLDEAHIAMSLTHSNIVQVLDLGEAEDRYFLALEYIAGWNLNEILQRSGKATVGFPTELAFYIAAEVCRALAYAHHKTRDGKPLNIVHRDVSPHNVLISEQGEVKLADFGIAKATDRRERSVSGAIKGKIGYMSPEQAKGTELDHRSDLFSMGVMLYLMSTGRSPFEAPTDLEMFLKVQAAEFDPPEVKRPEIDPAVARVISQAMRKDPAERYQSAEDMLVDIEQVLRTVLKPAGQTELKRWLAALAAKDGALPVGRGPGSEAVALEAPRAFGLDPPSLELVPMWAEPTHAALSEPGLRSSASFVRDGVLTRADRSTPSGSGGRAGGEPGERRSGLGAGAVLLVLLALLAGGAAAAYFKVLPGFDEGAGGDAARGPGRVSTGAMSSDDERATKDGDDEGGAGGTAGAGRDPDEKGTSLPTTTAEPATVAVVVTAAPPATAAPVTAAETAASSAMAWGDRDKKKTEGDDVDEEASEETERSLLRDAVADVARAVLGEDEGEPESAPKTSAPVVATAAPGRTGAPAAASGGPGSAKRVATAAPVVAPKPAPTVSIRITSVPSGAVVRSKTRVFGRTPLTLQFKPGIKYELRFVKGGFYTAKKSFYASWKKGQSVKAYLKKAKKGR